jgi:hypothetical protein
MIGFVIKTVAVLVVLFGICVAGYAYLGDMSADATQSEIPVELNATQ